MCAVVFLSCLALFANKLRNKKCSYKNSTETNHKANPLWTLANQPKSTFCQRMSPHKEYTISFAMSYIQLEHPVAWTSVLFNWNAFRTCLPVLLLVLEPLSHWTQKLRGVVIAQNERFECCPLLVTTWSHSSARVVVLSPRGVKQPHLNWALRPKMYLMQFPHLSATWYLGQCTFLGIQRKRLEVIQSFSACNMCTKSKNVFALYKACFCQDI